MKYFHGEKRSGPYLKHQSRHGQSLALIPAFHIDHTGRRSASLQVITSDGPFTAIRPDIMGPFGLFAGMQCSHGIMSMGHRLEGTLNLNGEILDFSDGTGYIETDRGRSFPSRYLWTQCVWGGPEIGSQFYE